MIKGWFEIKNVSEETIELTCSIAIAAAPLILEIKSGETHLFFKKPEEIITFRVKNDGEPRQ